MIRLLRSLFAAWRRGASTGSIGERLARRHLSRHGYRILARNLQQRHGEIDLLAEDPDGRTIVVVEVKASKARPDTSPPPEHRVNRHKRRKLTALAGAAARRGRLTNRPIRFDVIAVDLDERGKTRALRHHVGAFEATV